MAMVGVECSISYVVLDLVIIHIVSVIAHLFTIFFTSFSSPLPNFLTLISHLKHSHPHNKTNKT